MGCCLTTSAAAANNNHRHPSKSNLKTPPSQSAPPPFEEETVKEVLSETPIIPKIPPPVVVVDHPELLQSEERKTETGAVDLTKNPSEEIQGNVSEMSEMYSYSESFSAATTATVVDTKKDEIEMDDDGEVTQKVKNRSPTAKRVPRKRTTVSSGEVGGRKDRAARPVVRRQTAPSPEKKNQLPSRTVNNAQRHRNVGTSNDARKEAPARRSRSPALRGEAGQRRKVREKSPEKPRDIIPVNAEEKVMTEKKANEGGVSTEPEPEPATSESLENPLVSLECFIFL